MNLNRVFILGRLTDNPQIRVTSGGQSVVGFSVATNRAWTDKNGAKQEEAEYHNVVAWGRQAEIINQFLNKGSLILVEGRLRTRTWQDKQGQNRKTTEIICERMQLGPRPGTASESTVRRSEGKNFGQNAFKDNLPEIDIEEEEIKSEDLPF